MPKLSEITSVIETSAPLMYQEDFDNSGLLVGKPEKDVKAALLTLDVTETIIDEAISKEADVIITHHPLIFKGLKSLTGATDTERSIIKALQHDIAIYAAHTNLDNACEGLNFQIAEKLGLSNIKILNPFTDFLFKLTVFVPNEYAGKVRNAIFDKGAGSIGDYDNCSYNLLGQGSFKGGENTNPFAGQAGELHFEEETRIETVVPKDLLKDVEKALVEAHPYEEPAYDLYPLKNSFPKAGLGVTGSLEQPMQEEEFLQHIKSVYNIPFLKHTPLFNRPIQEVALCGGTGVHLINQAKSAGADVFITSDFKYHQFFEAENEIILLDVGHYESEQFAKELFYKLIRKKFPNFVLHFSEINTNPVNYY